MLFMTLYKSENDTQYEYSIHDIQKSLFDLYNLSVVSRINGRLRKEIQYSFETEIEKANKIRELFNTKIKEGYKVLYTFPREMDDRYKENIG